MLEESGQVPLDTAILHTLGMKSPPKLCCILWGLISPMHQGLQKC